MLDRYLHPLLKPLLNGVVTVTRQSTITANHVTILGFFIGVLALPLLAFDCYKLALLCIILNRLCDGLDGAIARLNGLTDAGGFLDISLDFIFYAIIPLGFVLANPAVNGVAGAFLLFSFMGNGSSFLAFATLASKHSLENIAYPHKSFYYLGGLTEGTETIIFFILFTLFPDYFPYLATLFGVLCCITLCFRLIFGYKLLQRIVDKQ